VGGASLGKHGRLIVAALLALQLSLLWLSLGPLGQASVFCTGPNSSPLAGAFGGLHLLFLALAVLGLVSLRIARLRLLYAVLLVIGVAALPLQAKLVSEGLLTCDGP
jgi:hypothetical protein